MSPDSWGVRENIRALEQQLALPLLFLIFSSDLLSLDGSQVLSCLSAPLVTFSKLYIQNEIPSLQEWTISERSQNLEDTFPALQGFSNAHRDTLCMISFSFLFSSSPHSSASLSSHTSVPTLHLILGQDFNLLFDLFSATFLGKVQIALCSQDSQEKSTSVLQTNISYQ